MLLSGTLYCRFVSLPGSNFICPYIISFSAISLFCFISNSMVLIFSNQSKLVPSSVQVFFFLGGGWGFKFDLERDMQHMPLQRTNYHKYIHISFPPKSDSHNFSTKKRLTYIVQGLGQNILIILN